ncbi:hypothetical protein EW146_g7447 [Bondarzewia mesenterica]|uniref:Uncharacterized protein n=1 Tax=Bondarzewia mesenterica TaxID=1095465 RepID=A0A4S4LKS3_9AGAM|nr:hypothetical protein EW146_g7447 [Bondarzewia mesenterica]
MARTTQYNPLYQTRDCPRLVAKPLARTAAAVAEGSGRAMYLSLNTHVHIQQKAKMCCREWVLLQGRCPCSRFVETPPGHATVRPYPEGAYPFTLLPLFMMHRPPPVPARACPRKRPFPHPHTIQHQYPVPSVSNDLFCYETHASSTWHGPRCSRLGRKRRFTGHNRDIGTLRLFCLRPSRYPRPNALITAPPKLLKAKLELGSRIAYCCTRVPECIIMAIPSPRHTPCVHTLPALLSVVPPVSPFLRLCNKRGWAARGARLHDFTPKLSTRTVGGADGTTTQHAPEAVYDASFTHSSLTSGLPIIEHG